MPLLIPLLFVFLQIRAFVSNPESTSKQELNQSPLAFVETASEPGLEEALKRKDNIIHVRNAQISALWDELHTRQPWKNAIKGEDIVSFPEDAANTTRKLAVLGINTVRFQEQMFYTQFVYAMIIEGKVVQLSSTRLGTMLHLCFDMHAMRGIRHCKIHRAVWRPSAGLKGHKYS